MLKSARLKLSTAKPLPASAWFVPGDDVASWLIEIAQWTVETYRLKLYPLSISGTNQPAGLLIVPPSGVVPPPGSRGQPYGEPASGFYIPIDAVIAPPLAAAEWVSLSLHAVSVYHPVFGLVGFAESDARRVSDLLNLSIATSERWSAARFTPNINRRIRSVRLAVTLSINDVFGEESREIGSEPLIDLPQTDYEAGEGFGKTISQGAVGLFVRGIIGLASLIPRTSGIAPTWINHIENWAKSTFFQISAQLEYERNKELHRLIELLEKDPEKALRHAISLAQLANRGKAPPSTRLGNRDLKLSLNRLGGGRPADRWAIDAKIRQTLTQRYRDNAQRELKLGRYRRAAYIYAELLGDFSLAADALKQGKFFREAAILYKDRLYKPLLAAECLGGGGLIDEAIEIYEKHDRWIEIADLYERIAVPEKATAALRRAVQGLVDKGDVLAASRLVETRLHAAEEALALLASTWPTGKQAMTCLEERIGLLSRLYRADDLRTLTVRLGRDTAPARLNSELITLLARTSENALSVEVSRVAAEAVRLRASVALSELSIERADELAILRALTRLVPHDKLLSRDVGRYRDRRPLLLAPKSPAPSPKLIRRLALTKTKSLSLPQVGQWVRVEGNTDGFAAVCRRERQRIFFARGTWELAQQVFEWTDLAPAMESAFFLKTSERTVLLGRPFSPGFAIGNLPKVDLFRDDVRSVGTPDWLPQDTAQITCSRETIWAARVVSSRVVITSFHHDGTHLSSYDVTDNLIAAGAGHGGALSLDVLGSPGCVAMGYGNCLVVLRASKSFQIEVRAFEQRVTGVLPSNPAVPGWIAVLERGAAFVSSSNLDTASLDESISNPRAARLYNGSLVLIGSEEGKIFQQHSGQWLPAGWFPAPTEFASAIALTGTNEAREFALFQSSGSIQRWTLEP